MKFKWKKFVNKVWNKGVKDALQDVVNDSSNAFDNLGLSMADQFINGYFKPELDEIE